MFTFGDGSEVGFEVDSDWFSEVCGSFLIVVTNSEGDFDLFSDGDFGRLSDGDFERCSDIVASGSSAIVIGSVLMFLISSIGEFDLLLDGDSGSVLILVIRSGIKRNRRYHQINGTKIYWLSISREPLSCRSAMAA